MIDHCCYVHVMTIIINHIHVLVLWEEPADSVVVELNPRPPRALGVWSSGRDASTMARGLTSRLRWDSPLGSASRTSPRAPSALGRHYAALEELCDGSCPGFRLLALKIPVFRNPIRELLTCERRSSPPTENSFHPSASFYFLFQNFVLLLARLLARQTDYKYDPSECPHPYPENKSCVSQPGSCWSSQDAAQKLQPDGSRTPLRSEPTSSPHRRTHPPTTALTGRRRRRGGE